MAGIPLMPGIRLRMGIPTELYPVSMAMMRHASVSRQKKLASCPGGPAGMPRELRNVVKYGLPLAYISWFPFKAKLPRVPCGQVTPAESLAGVPKQFSEIGRAHV